MNQKNEATAPEIAPGEQWPFNTKWSGRRDSNPQPSAWEADALPLRHSRTAFRTSTLPA